MRDKRSSVKAGGRLPIDGAYLAVWRVSSALIKLRGVLPIGSACQRMQRAHGARAHAKRHLPAPRPLRLSACQA